MRKTKTRAKQYVDKNPIEQIFSIGSGVAQAGTDLGKQIAAPENWDKILGLISAKGEKELRTSGDLFEGQELNLKKLHEKNSKANEAKHYTVHGEKKAEIEPGIDYAGEIIHAEKRAFQRENQELEKQLREIANEIKRLADSSRELQMQFKDIAIEQHTATPGKYHKSFFSWLLSVIRNARTKVEDSGAWLAAMHSKKKSREYGAMSKKHGTSFSLSNERVVATQVG